MRTAHKVGLSAAVGALLLAAANFITPFEGVSLHPYRDIGGVPTVCGGLTHVPMRTYTASECNRLMMAALPKYDAGLQRCVHVALTDGQHVALLSAAWNLGVGAVCKSSMVRNFNAGNPRAACNAFLLYNRAAGRVLAGLSRRRQAERKMCLEGI